MAPIGLKVSILTIWTMIGRKREVTTVLEPTSVATPAMTVMTTPATTGDRDWTNTRLSATDRDRPDF